MIDVAYKCSCMPAERVVPCLPRYAGEDVADWMGMVVQPSLYLDHRAHSPLCRMTKMEYAKLYVPNADAGIGYEPTKQ